MCILFIAVEQHLDYPLIICANRDEFHQRPTQAIHWWENENLLAGKDLQAGGTWLGINQHGRFSALTNFRQPQQHDVNKRSRGELVVNAIKHTNESTTQQLRENAAQYNGFNLVFGDLDNLYAFDSVNQTLKNIDKGFHSVCNGALDDIWPKMSSGIQHLEQLTAEKTINIEKLFSLMSNQNTITEEHLPETGIGKVWEKLLSSIFIVSPDYGTRSTTIILQTKDDNIDVHDRTYDPLGKVTGKNLVRIKS